MLHIIKKSETGYSLIEVMISLLMLVFAGYMASRTMKAQWLSAITGKKMGEIEDIRDYIRSSFDCKKTLVNMTQSCGITGGVPFKGLAHRLDKNGNVIVLTEASPRTVDYKSSKPNEKYRIQGECIDTGSMIKFNIRVAREKQGIPLKSTDWQPLFPVPLTCPRAVPTSIAASTYHACATDSYGRAKCWGENRHGQLGNGEVVSNSPYTQTIDGVPFDDSILVDRPSDIEPNPVKVTMPEKDVEFVSLALGGLDVKDGGLSGIGITDMEHSCAIDSVGRAWCWGSDNQGAIGVGNTVDNERAIIAAFVMPQKVINIGKDSPSGKAVKDIVAGFHHNCVRLDDGTMKCWGRHCGGETGYKFTGNWTTMYDIWNPDRLGRVINWPVATDFKVRSMAAGGRRSCAVMESGWVNCWGFDNYGELGLGLTTQYVTWDGPQTLLSLGQNLVDSISIGFHQMCVLKTNGKIACTGRNDYGQLGLNHIVDQNVNIEIPLFDGLIYKAKKVVSGGYHTCAIRDDDTLWCWGRNDVGQVGVPVSGASILQPVNVSLPARVKDVALGALSTCAFLRDETVRCWGSNDKGQLGNSVPVGNYLDNPASQLAIVPL